MGKNDGWKQGVNIGKRNNQNFVQIPHARLIEMLDYKCRLTGIQLVTVNEAYTSKCSAVDLEPIQKHSQYLGKRVHRGLFRTASSKVINADINGRNEHYQNVFSRDIHQCRGDSELRRSATEG